MSLVQYAGFVGQTYSGQSRQAAGERCMNLYPQAVEVPSAKGQVNYFGTPGTALDSDGGAGPARGAYREQKTSRSFFVIGSTLYERTAPGVLAIRGSIGGSGPVSITSNGLELAIAASGTLYVYNLSTGALTQPVNVSDVINVFLDGYFVALEPHSQQFQISGSYDGNSWDGLDFASVEGTPANVVAMVADHREIWFFSQDHGEVFYDSGNQYFPIERIDGAYFEMGCAARFSACQFDNSIAWLGNSPRGGGIAWKTEGYSPKRISTHAVEWAWSQYPRIDDAIAYTYEEKGHTFWVITFPSANPVDAYNALGATWVYDAATRMWHERGWWDTVNGVYTQSLGQFHLWDGQKHLVCGLKDGKVYEQNITLRDDAGNPLRWFRSAPHVYSEGNRLYFRSFLLDMQLGQGLQVGQGSDPQVFLQMSNDGGMTWGNEHWTSCGKIGQYEQRVRWTQLGSARDRCFMIGGSDPIQLCLMNAYIDVEAGTN